MIQTAALTSGLYTLLAADATLASLIADYGAPAGPAIFTGATTPDDTRFTRGGSGTWPIVAIGPVESAEILAESDTLDGQEMWNLERQIFVYGVRTGDTLPLERAADRIAEIIDGGRLEIAVVNHLVEAMDADPPISAEGPDEETVARSVKVSINITRVA